MKKEKWSLTKRELKSVISKLPKGIEDAPKVRKATRKLLPTVGTFIIYQVVEEYMGWNK